MNTARSDARDNIRACFPFGEVNNVGTKNRLLYIKQFLETQTDEQHSMTLAEITDSMKQAGFPCCHKTIKNDIKQLLDSGVDVICNKGRENQYFIGDRHFELPELKLLVDAVQASKFISTKKANS